MQISIVRLVSLLVLTLLWSSCSAVQTTPSLPESTSNQPKVAGQILVKFAPQTTDAQIQKIMQQMGLKMIRQVSPPNLFLVETIGKGDIGQIVEALRGHDAVIWAEPNLTRKSG